MKWHVKIIHFQTITCAHIQLFQHKFSEKVMTDLVKMLLLVHHMYRTTIFKTSDTASSRIWNLRIKTFKIMNLLWSWALLLIIHKTSKAQFYLELQSFRVFVNTKHIMFLDKTEKQQRKQLSSLNLTSAVQVFHTASVFANTEVFASKSKVVDFIKQIIFGFVFYKSWWFL